MAEGLSHRLWEMRDRASSVGQDRTREALLAELQALAHCFDEALRDVAALALPDTLGRAVPGATNELDAVVRHTAEATEIILDECERLEAAMADMSCRPAVSAMATRIYEACSFQDIVGQRLAKVIRAMQAFEAKTAEILRVFGPLPDDMPRRSFENGLLNGPQHRLAGLDQVAVDALLAGA